MTTEAVPRIRVGGIAKSFGGVAAIRSADLAVRPGTVHALVGENGAGKSTLIKIISGAEVPDRGVIEFDGRPVTLAGTAEAMALGVATVYQEPQLFAELTVTENIFTGRELRRAGRVDWRRQRDQVDELLRLIGLPERLATRPVGQLPIAVQQQVSIAKALAQQASVLILDEPSAILTEAEIEVLFRVVRRLTERGVSVIYISHRLDELVRIADEVTIMRDGRTLGTQPIGELKVRRIAELMVGGAIEERAREHPTEPGAPVLRLEGLAGEGFQDVQLSIKEGEIVALYGLVGSGTAEIAGALWGMTKITGGTVVLRDRPVRPRSPRHAQRLGIGLLPADRKRQGLFAFQSIAFNVSAGQIPLLSRLGLWFDRRREREIARAMIERLAIRSTGERQPVGTLSGGNAQKAVLARQLVDPPALLVLAEPTQGVDVGAKEEIHRLIAELADQGAAIMVVTADLPEALRIADRVVVVRDGSTTTEFGPEASQVDVLAAASGDESEPAR
ncbi:sugar ABC transporter ATP-binding protein [Microlunatus sp. GCM10028923]|uniref:sugar ABC transporter ATP-binding protein n=1 Tax=Microlunatus sp. GCM10028923 TaxID=3273400 RepID=UPI003607E071